MQHFPSSPRDGKTSSGLNATQRNASADPMFSLIHDELHDARRVHKHGQEDDLRAALDMVIRRVESMSTQLSDALKSQADLEVQLNMAKSNLSLVIANNEMLEEALKSSSGGNNELGWRRSSSSQRPQPPNNRGHKDSMDSFSSDLSTSSRPAPEPQPSSSRFLRSFKIGGGSSGTVSNGNSRPGTPAAKGHVLSSPSMPSLPTQVPPSPSSTEVSKRLESEMEALRAELSASQAAHTSLEEELESLSQALFEEANNMVKAERIKRAEMEEELHEVREEREALRSALKVMGQKESATSNYEEDQKADERTLKRSSSRAAVKSPPPESPSPEPDEADTTVMPTSDSASSSSEQEVVSTLTTRSASSDSSFATPPTSFKSPPVNLTEEPSPWADAPSSPVRQDKGSSMLAAASMYSSR